MVSSYTLYKFKFTQCIAFSLQGVSLNLAFKTANITATALEN